MSLLLNLTMGVAQATAKRVEGIEALKLRPVQAPQPVYKPDYWVTVVQQIAVSAANSSSKQKAKLWCNLALPRSLLRI